MSDYMTGAELQILREACGLTRDDLAQRCGVQARSVRYWENGSFGVPADVASLVIDLDAKIENEIEAKTLHTLAKTIGAVLLRTDDALKNATVSRVAAVMRVRGRPCRIINFDAGAYAAWCAEVGLSGPGHESNWAVHALRTMQAHRSDQPR